MQQALDGVLRNFPVRPVAWLLRVLVFPLGLRERPPGDRLGHRVAGLMLNPSEARDRLAAGIFYGNGPQHMVGLLERALPIVIAAEPIERKLAKALKTSVTPILEPAQQLEEALRQGWIGADEARLLGEARALTHEIISVDDFDSDELQAAARRPRAQLRSVA
jgi:acyl-CoA dehydrogenase